MRQKKNNPAQYRVGEVVTIEWRPDCNNYWHEQRAVIEAIHSPSRKMPYELYIVKLLTGSYIGRVGGFKATDLRPDIFLSAVREVQEELKSEGAKVK